MRRVCWLAFVALAIALSAAACGGENGGEGTPPTVVTSPQAATPFPTPIITGNRLESPNKGYAVNIPEGWSVDANILAFGRVTADAFFAPIEIAGVQPSISVSREEIGDEFSFQTYADAKAQAAEAIGAQDLARQTGPTIAGRETSVISYGLTRDNVQLAKQDVVLVDDGFGWLITLTVAAEESATFEPTFDEFLASFELLALAQPTAGAE